MLQGKLSGNIYIFLPRSACALLLSYSSSSPKFLGNIAHAHTISLWAEKKSSPPFFYLVWHRQEHLARLMFAVVFVPFECIAVSF